MQLDDLIDTSTAPPSEMSRILALPSWFVHPDSEEAAAIAAKWDARFSHGEGRLRPVQGLAFESVERAGCVGGLLPIGVGYGKSLISLLLPRVFGVGDYETLILVPASMRAALVREARKHRELGFAIQSRVHVASYAELSDPGRGPRLLAKHAPKLIIADEAHYLKARARARTRRLLRHFREHPETIFVGMSGTLTTRSIKDFAHLAELALRGGSPLPTTWSSLETWACTIDVDSPMNVAEQWQWRAMQRLVDWYRPTDRVGPIEKVSCLDRKDLVRDAFHERLVRTAGVVHTSRSALGTTLVIDPIDNVRLPDTVVAAIERADREWILPGDEDIEDPLAHARAIRQLTTGFYYRWVWPDGAPDREWLSARAEWHRACRAVTRLGREGLETEALVAGALRSGALARPEAAEALRDWDAIRDRCDPPTEAVWLDDYLLRDVLARAEAATTPATVWYTHRAVADRLVELGADVVRPGATPPANPSPSGRALCLSIRSHGVGQNLQAWSRAFVISPPVGGAVWEQLLGRLHRPGQTADEVVYSVYTHTTAFASALDRARVDAEYIQRTQGQAQKLLTATYT